MRKLYIGIDGGGTKTLGVLADDTGAILATCTAGSSAIVGAPSPEACAVLQSVTAQLGKTAGVRLETIARFGLGLNGVDFPDEAVMQHEVLARLLGISPERFVLVNDGIVALWGATSAPAAAILQHGTGFVAAYRSAFGKEQAFANLDIGRFYDLRVEVLALVARMIDGRAPISPLKDAILHVLGCPAENDYEERVFLKKYSPAQWAGVLPAVFRVAGQGDPVTLALIEHAIADYVCTAGALMRKTGASRPEVIFGGGRLLSAPDWFWNRLVEGVQKECPGVTVKRPEKSPAIGAVIMAAHADGCPPGRFFEPS